jgi:UDP-2,3-diacylglucosamine pyrophosphatase LpxH
MDQDSVKAMIVFSDTHLGLSSWKRWIFQNTITSKPTIVHQFVRWLLDLENAAAKEVLIGDERGRISPKKLLSPDVLVLNGDILELWDASDRAVDIFSRSIFNDLMRLRCKKLYLAGNHDYAIKELEGYYPWGDSSLDIIRDTYPPAERKEMKTVKMGENYYLLLHGHQLSQTMRIAPWIIISLLRDGAEAFGSYSWILVAFLGIMSATSMFLPIFTPTIPLLAALAIPRLFVSIARPIWNKLPKRHRYNRKAAAEGFVDWWKSFLQGKDNFPSRMHIVYGHTHLTDLISSKQELEKLSGSKIDGPDLVLINHAAWVKDESDKYKNVMQAVFVYIAADGFEFFGWDWDRKRPFHIPKQIIPLRLEGAKLESEKAELLHDLEWPEELIEEWKTTKGSGIGSGA